MKNDYLDVLQCDEWRKLRHEMIHGQAKYTCQKCIKKFNYWDLQIHHKIYVNGRKPWEYDRKEDLIVVCFGCHCQLHEKPIAIFDINENYVESRLYKVINCEKCNGEGFIENLKGSIEYNDGICYDCQGTGKQIDLISMFKDDKFINYNFSNSPNKWMHRTS